MPAASCRILAGMVYVKDLSKVGQPLLPIGNAQAALAMTETTITLPDYTNPAGGDACSVSDISAVDLTLTMYDFRPDNVALAVFGDANKGAGAVVVAEPVEAFAGGAVNPLAHIPTAGTVVVKVGATVYVEGTDYSVSGAGFTVTAGSALETAILAAVTDPKVIAVTVDYTWAASVTVEALTQSGKTFEVFIDGKNVANNNSKEVWRIWKAQFGPAAAVDIISRAFGSMVVKAALLPDATKPVGQSQFFAIQTPA